METVSRKTLTQPITIHEHYRGNLNATMQIVIYADFADPDFIPIDTAINDLLKRYVDDICVAYRHFPQVIKHPFSFAVAQAIEAAGKQEKFWQMLNRVVAHQDKLSDGKLRHYAEAIGVNKAQFEDDFSDASLVKHIKQDIDSGKASGVNRAPAIFIKGVRQQSLSLQHIQELIAGHQP